MDSSSRRTIKGYDLLEQLGEGAYGAVYRAHQPLIEREVAVKVILPQYANQPDFIRRFETEAQLVAQLEHIHIVPLYDYWRDPDGAYLVMRLMRGGSLAETLNGSGPWAPQEAADLVDQLASALEAAHQKGIVHRDLKPANILLDEQGNAYLSDFGIAKELGAELEATQTGAILGTPAYITPEQVKSQPITPQTDIYALGVLLYQLLVGDHPFPDSTNAELVVKHLQEALPYVREARPELPAALDGVIQRATAKDPADRYPDAVSLASDFRRALQLEGEVPEVPEEEIYNPYKGLRAFQVADAEDFFGRETLTGQLLAHLASPSSAGRFLAVVGPSGSGKSSVVKAGLVPALRKGALPGSKQWFTVEMHPGARPLNELALALLSISTNPGLDLFEELNQGEEGLLQAARSMLPDKESELLLVIDQFEELFSLVEEEKRRSRFLELLHAAVTHKDSQVRVVLTLRADFYDRPLMHPHFGRLVEEHTVVVLPLTPEELEQAIRRPAERAGVVLEKDLVPTISTDVVDQPGALPLLQYALTELFDRREGRMLTNQAYQDIGGVLGALGRRAEEVYAGLDRAGKDAAKQLFLRLVTLGEGAEDTRRRVLRAELEALTSRNKSGRGSSPSPTSGKGLSRERSEREDHGVRAVLESFGRARLLSFDHDPATRGPTVEVAHEALLREWRRLREWLDESRADIRMQVVLREATAAWLEGGEESSYLLRGSRLAQFETWSEETSLAMTADEGRFLETSLAFEAERKAQQAALERRSRNFLRALVVVFAVAAIVAVGLTIFAFNQQSIAQANALEADQNAATALAEADARATQQAIAEAEADQRATQQAIAENESLLRAEAEQQALEDRDRAVEAEQDALVRAAIGLAGQAMNEMDGTAPERSVPLALEALEDYPYTWQAHRALGTAVINHKLDMNLTHNDTLFFTQLSEDGKRLLASSWDDTVRVWDTENGEELLVVSDVTDPYATWSPDETKMLILVGNEEDGMWFEIRDSSSGELLFTQTFDSQWGMFRQTLSRPYQWSPSGEQFVTAHADGSARVWEAASGEEFIRLSGHEGPVIAYWSPAGDLILTNGIDDKLIIMWDAVSGQPLYTLTAPADQGSFRSWSPSGDRFITRDFGKVTIYESVSGKELLNLEIPGVLSSYAEFSPDGTQLITSGFHDGNARLWDANTGRLLSIISGMTQAQKIAWSPSGSMAAVGGVDGLVRIWDTNTGNIREELVFPSDVHYIDWSPNEDKIFVGGSYDVNVRIYRLNQAMLTLPGLSGATGFSDWSPDGRHLGISVADGSIPIWNAESGMEVYNINSGEWFGGLAWSPSGDRILTWNVEGPLRVWDAESGNLLVESPHPEETIFNAAWSPDGSKIVGTYWEEEGKVAIWDANTLEEHTSFLVRGWAAIARWSPDGKRIATTSFNGEAAIRDATTGDVLLQLFPDDYSNSVDGITWTNDGQQVILFSSGTGHRFDAVTGDELMQYIGHSGNTFTIRLSPDQKLIYTSAGDGTARVFEVATGTELLVYEVGGWAEVALSPDGNLLFIYSGEGRGYLYPTWDTTNELIDYAKECCILRDLTPEERELFGLPER